MKLRMASILLANFFLASATPANAPTDPVTVGVPVPVDLNGAGEVMATLNDWRAILFVSLIITALVLSFCFYCVRQLVLSQRQSHEAQNRANDAMHEWATAMALLSANLTALNNTVQSWGVVMTRVDTKQTPRSRRKKLEPEAKP